MKGKCKYCTKQMQCKKSIGFIYGYCVTDFTPAFNKETIFAMEVTEIIKWKNWYNFNDAEVIKCIREFFEEYGTEPLWAEFQNGDDEVKDGIAMMVWENATK